MAVLMMARPWKHTKTGVYYFRLIIPKDLRPFAKGNSEEPRHEYKRSLHTKDPRMAKRLYADVAARCDDYLSELRARKAKAINGATSTVKPQFAAQGAPSEYSRESLVSLAGELANEIFAAHAAHPGPPAAFKLNNSFPPGPWGSTADPWAGQRFLLIMGKRNRHQSASAQESVSEPARAFLAARGMTLTVADWERFCEVARGAMDSALESLQRRYRGDLSDSTLRERFPVVATPASRPKVSIKGLIETWAKGKANVRPRTREKYARRLRQFAEFLRHNDAMAVNADHLMQWRDHLKAEGLDAKTIEDDSIGVVRTIFRAARGARVLPSYPFTDYVPLKRGHTRAKPRHPYSEKQTVQVLSAARTETGALRWLPWLMAYTGARVGEMAQLNKDDVRTERDIPFLRVTDVESGQATKTRASIRDVPLHRALKAEGFLTFVEKVADGPLFPDLPVSKYGTRADAASDRYMHWLRNVVGINDPKIVGHSWRHRMEDELREIDAPTEVAAAITGRTMQGSRAGYGRGVSLRKKAEWLAKVPAVKVPRATKGPARKIVA